MAFDKMHRERAFLLSNSIFVSILAAVLVVNHFYGHAHWSAVVIPALFSYGVALFIASIIRKTRLFNPDWERKRVEKYLGRKL